MQVMFGSHVLNEVMPDPQGDVPYTYLTCSVPGMSIMLCKLSAGSSYRPVSHDRRVQVVFLEGSGIFMLDGKSWEYPKHSRFVVEAGIDHRFALVRANTFFLKKFMVHDSRLVPSG